MKVPPETVETMPAGGAVAMGAGTCGAGTSEVAETLLRDAGLLSLRILVSTGLTNGS